MSVLCAVVCGGCGADGQSAPGSEDGAAPDAAQPDAGDADGGADAGEDAGRYEGCRAPDGVETGLRTIAGTAELLNALPRPVTVACFVESLARPLALHAADSVLSAQPADGRRSPRVFIHSAGLTLTVVPSGQGAHLLELGEARPGDMSLKAELEFPIDRTLDAAAPYERLPYSEQTDITTCGFCHQGETVEPGAGSPHAVVSPAIRPMPSQRVPLDELRAEADACDADAEPERCAILRALFAGSPAPIDYEFPESYRTFF